MAGTKISQKDRAKRQGKKKSASVSETGEMIHVAAIVELQRTTVELWHHMPFENPYRGFLALVCEQHRRNFELWH